jgi:branched-chain amino acid aminotransferase
VKNGELITPPSYLGILEGVTRNTILEIAEKKGYPTAEKVFTRHDIFVADECFLSGTAAEMIPVVKVDGRTIGEDGKPGKITKDLMKAYRDLVMSEGTEIYSAD